jgi:hypothetical protein
LPVLVRVIVFLAGFTLAGATFLSAVSTFVLPRAKRTLIDRLVFGLLRALFRLLLRFIPGFTRRDALLAYYAPIGLMLLVPTWYILIAAGYTCMYWALGVSGWLQSYLISGSSLLTLGFASPENRFWVASLEFSEATLGLVLVALLISYLPTLYSAFSRREREVTLLEVRAGHPPSAVDMLLRFYRIHGLNSLDSYWPPWEVWFADLGESHSVLPALVFFRSPAAQNSWVTAAGTVLDAAALTLSAVDIPASVSAQLSIRAGFIALRRVCDGFGLDYPPDPHFPQEPISIQRAEFEGALERLAAAGLPLKADREQAWRDFAGWRVNYDRPLLALSDLVMAPPAPWNG